MCAVFGLLRPPPGAAQLAQIDSDDVHCFALLTRQLAHINRADRAAVLPQESDPLTLTYCSLTFR